MTASVWQVTPLVFKDSQAVHDYQAHTQGGGDSGLSI